LVVVSKDSLGYGEGKREMSGPGRCLKDSDDRIRGIAAEMIEMATLSMREDRSRKGRDP
jgi:hypothetical protein